MLGCKHCLTKKLTDLTKYVKPNTSVIYRSIEEDLEKIKKGENKLRASFETTSIAYNQKNQEYLELSNRAAGLSNYIREGSAALEKTEEKLAEFNEKIKLATSENENNRLKDIKAAVSNLRAEIKEMDQKKEIMSWELRRHLLRQKNRGKDDYL